MYKLNDLIAPAKRENNSKRNFLLVNRLQGKHVPVRPKESLELFSALAKEIAFPQHSLSAEMPLALSESSSELRSGGALPGDGLLVIGFAETATAIGAHVAIRLGARYIQTTRENYKDCDYLFFSEEHSHASEQRLIRNELDKAVGHIHDILFVEDEITTGKTIRNIVRLLRKTYGDSIRFHAASLINAMDQKSEKLFAREYIRCYFLLKADHSLYDEAASQVSTDGSVLSLYPSPKGEQISCDNIEGSELSFTEISGRIDARRLCYGKDYEKACRRLQDQLQPYILAGLSSQTEQILVLGTEECMYPAIFVGAELERHGYQVRTHSTTRSPICVSREEGYPLQTRFDICSPYEESRKTFIYNLQTYDSIYVITDADCRGTLIPALQACGNQKIHWIRWCDDENFL